MTEDQRIIYERELAQNMGLGWESGTFQIFKAYIQGLIGTGGASNLFTLVSTLATVDLNTITGTEQIGIINDTTGFRMTLIQLAQLIGASVGAGASLGTIKFVSSSRFLEADDEEKFLVIGNDNPGDLILSIPEESIFVGGKTLSMYFITPGGYNNTFEGPVTHCMYKTTEGNDFLSLAEKLTFFTYNEEAGGSGLSMLSASVATTTDSFDGKTKTFTRYIYDNFQPERVVTLGGISPTDINSSPASNVIVFTLPTDIPIGYYVDGLYPYIGEAFDADISEIRILLPQGEIPIDLGSFYSFYRNTTPAFYSETTGSVFVQITFSDVNPQNLSEGEFRLLAILKKFPIPS